LEISGGLVDVCEAGDAPVNLEMSVGEVAVVLDAVVLALGLLGMCQ
jgi:hypothetical protein